jgi:hypothetical protein
MCFWKTIFGNSSKKTKTSSRTHARSVVTAARRGHVGVEWVGSRAGVFFLPFPLSDVFSSWDCRASQQRRGWG